MALKRNNLNYRKNMKTRITIHREGNYFVAIDHRTYVADQGTTREEAIRNLTSGLKEHHRLLQEIKQQK